MRAANSGATSIELPASAFRRNREFRRVCWERWRTSVIRFHLRGLTLAREGSAMSVSDLMQRLAAQTAVGAPMYLSLWHPQSDHPQSDRYPSGNPGAHARWRPACDTLGRSGWCGPARDDVLTFRESQVPRMGSAWGLPRSLLVRPLVAVTGIGRTLGIGAGCTELLSVAGGL
jgi:hypothetical protein